MGQSILKKLAAVAAVSTALAVLPAQATLTFTLGTPNPELALGGNGPYGVVTVELGATKDTATVKLIASGSYSFGDGSTIGLNLNSLEVNTPAFSDFTLVGRTGGKTPTIKAVTLHTATPLPTVDGWGEFNFLVDLNGGFGESATQVSFTLTRSTGTWANEDAILKLNSLGYSVVGHAMSTATDAKGDNITGFAVVPEPTTMIAGALLLLPFGVSTLRMLRRKS